LKLGVERIESDAALERYGMDSILALRLVSELEKVFGPLSKTLLFEYQSLDALAQYFLEQHSERLQAHFKPAAAGSSAAPVPPPQALTKGAERRSGRRARRPLERASVEGASEEAGSGPA